MQSEKNFTDIQASLEKKTDAWLRKRIYKKRICSWSRGSFDMKPNRSCSSMDYTNVVSSANGSPGQRKLLKREKKNTNLRLPLPLFCFLMFIALFCCYWLESGVNPRGFLFLRYIREYVCDTFFALIHFLAISSWLCIKFLEFWSRYRDLYYKTKIKLGVFMCFVAGSRKPRTGRGLFDDASHWNGWFAMKYQRIERSTLTLASWLKVSINRASPQEIILRTS